MANNVADMLTSRCF